MSVAFDPGAQCFHVLPEPEAVAELREGVAPGLLEDLEVEAFEFLVLAVELAVKGGDALGRQQAHPELLAVQGLRQVVVGAGLHPSRRWSLSPRAVRKIKNG
ncbi:MAG: hypothetical protein M3Q60_06340 [Actinomycetota bacterium]|nr:hypothetical protein [Actinomycetota bacterium]